MKTIYATFETEQDARDAVNFLMDVMGISAYKQGLTVYVDDGSKDDAP